MNFPALFQNELHLVMKVEIRPLLFITLKAY